ncbi:hypothetical protein HK405_003206 [Cladochytrium tenue]|nr:hypothetical protein HK405_003206 [Cladochytrium tenue]
MAYFASDRPSTPPAARRESRKRYTADDPLRRDSEDVWHVPGHDAQSLSTKASDFTVKQHDPRADAPRRIVFGSFGSGEDHIRLSGPVRPLAAPVSSAAARAAVGCAESAAASYASEISTQHRDYVTYVSESLVAVATAPPAGRPTPKGEPIAVVSETLLEKLRDARRR